MKFRIKELAIGYRLELCEPTLNPSDGGDGQTRFVVGETWIPIGHPYGSPRSARECAYEFARSGRVIEEFNVDAESELANA